jgi:hypothetical protein
MPMSPRLLRPTASRSGAGFDADAATYIRAVEAADGQALEPVVGVAINNFVVGCKADGIWGAIKASCILMGARTLPGALTPLVGTAPTNNGPFVSGDYTRGGSTPGLKGNGSTKFLASNRANNADPQNDFHMGLWVSTMPSNITSANPNYMGALTSAFTIIYNVGSASPVDGAACREAGTFPMNAISAVAGYRGMSRSSSTGYTYRNSSTNTSRTGTSAAPSSGDLNVFALSGTTGNRNDGRIAFYSIGTSLDLALLESRLSALVSAMATVT